MVVLLQLTISQTLAHSCRVSKAELANLANALLNTTQYLSGNLETENQLDRNSCSSLIAFIKEKVNYIGEQAKLLSGEFVDLATHKALQENFNKTVARFTNIIDALKKSHNQKIKSIITKYNTELERVQRKVTEARDLLAALIEQREGMSLALCASHIRDIEYNQAMDEFTYLASDNQLTEIVNRTYDEEHDNADKIVDFVKMLPRCNQEAIAYSKLYESMNSSHNLHNPNMLFFAQGVANYQHCSSVHEELHPKLQSYAENIISDWATNIRNSNYVEPEQFSRKSTKAGILFNESLLEIIRRAYASNVDNFNTNIHLQQI